MNLKQSEIADALGVSRQYVHLVLSKGVASERTVLAMRAVAEGRTGSTADAVRALRITDRKTIPKKEYKPKPKPAKPGKFPTKDAASILGISCVVLQRAIRAGEDYEPRLRVLQSLAEGKTGVMAKRVMAMTPRKEKYPYPHTLETPERLGVRSWVSSLANHCGIINIAVYKWIQKGIPDQWRDNVLAWVAENDIKEPAILSALGLEVPVVDTEESGS
jgi:hypothetical protein